MSGGDNYLEFERKKHIKFFNRILAILPNRYSMVDSNRITIAFFALSALDLLDALDTVGNRQRIIDWVYSLQVLPNKERTNQNRGGFRGGPSNGVTSPAGASTCEKEVYHDCGHIANTYTAIGLLLILGDSLNRLDKQACLAHVRALQLPNGSFKSTICGSESDMRFVYCACCISTMLDDFSAVDTDAACAFIKESFSYDGGFAQEPGGECHGGSTFCACASLKLMGQLDEVLPAKDVDRLQRWCLQRQRLGFHGRPHKDDDTCYSFWLGATLNIIDSFDLIDKERNKLFVLSCQDCVVGGFAKWPQVHPDAMHSYLGLCGMALMREFDLLEVHPALNITKRSVEHMEAIHKSWKAAGGQLRGGSNCVGEAAAAVHNADENAINYRTLIIAVVVGLGPAVFRWFWRQF